MDIVNPKSEIRNPKSGFTLVELLVVITIIGILIALLLPAVQGAREAARRVTCSNHVKQLALACLQHVEKHDRYPAGGWGFFWVGDADRGNGRFQPGGWVYNILPYLEQQALHDLPSDGQPDVHTTQQLDGAREMVRTPLSVLNCPTRRQSIPYPKLWGGVGGNPVSNARNATNNPSNDNVVGRLCYGISAGDTWPYAGGLGGPGSLPPPGQPYFPSGYMQFNGVCFVSSEVREALVTDGTSNTYLLGEKYLNPDHYVTGLVGDDNENWCTGFNNDNYRSSKFEPWQDTPGFNLNTDARYGSAHSAGFNVAFCDGSVRMIYFGIDMPTHHRLGSRNDGEPVDASKF